MAEWGYGGGDGVGEERDSVMEEKERKSGAGAGG